jgi:hypothetical protein
MPKLWFCTGQTLVYHTRRSYASNAVSVNEVEEGKAG